MGVLDVGLVVLNHISVFGGHPGVETIHDIGSRLHGIFSTHVIQSLVQGSIRSDVLDEVFEASGWVGDGTVSVLEELGLDSLILC